MDQVEPIFALDSLGKLNYQGYCFSTAVPKQQESHISLSFEQNSVNYRKASTKVAQQNQRGQPKGVEFESEKDLPWNSMVGKKAMYNGFHGYWHLVTHWPWG